MARARQNRRAALLAQAKCVVTTSIDGRTTEEHVFDSVPTLAAMIDRVGPDAFIAGVRMVRMSVRGLPGAAYAMAAE